MSSVLPGQNISDARHSQRSSLSDSQTSLPDQLMNSLAAAYSPSRSAVLLPTTTYGHGERSRPQSPVVNNSTKRGPSGMDAAQPGHTHDPVPTAEDPDDYYRKYQTGGPLRQGALRTTGFDDMPEATTALPRLRGEAGTSLIPQPGTTRMGARKSSVKNLVAQINATATEEPLPVPRTSGSQPVSRDISPVFSSTAQMPSADRLQNTADATYTQTYGSDEMSATGATSQPHISHLQTNRKPLFGEVVLDTDHISGPGYGIQPLDRRRGSEGSPSLATDPVLTGTAAREEPMGVVESRSSWGATPHQHQHQHHHGHQQVQQILSPQTYEPQGGARPRQQRANSESPLPSASFDSSTSFIPRPEAVTPQGKSRQYIGSQGLARTYAHDDGGGQDEIVRPEPGGADMVHQPNRRESRLAASASPVARNRASPRRKVRSPPQIVSPSSKNSKAQASTRTSDDNSASSLRANILVPPPKISPPLRSSRPRQPVSSASTASSRARMAEKFNTMQRINDEKRNANRRTMKPPELTDVDLKARRLRITQALSKSLEGHDLRGEWEGSRRLELNRSRTVSPFSPSDGPPSHGQVGNRVPAVVVDGSVTTESDREEFATPGESPLQEDNEYTRSALQAMQGTSFGNANDDEDDSPTLGRENRLTPIETGLLHHDQHREPASAVTDMTAETEGTTFDPEPQAEDYVPSSGQQQPVRPVYYRAPDTNQSLSPDDQADMESVHIVLRDTAYLDESEAIRAGYRQAPGATELVPPLPRVDNHSARSSWTSSSVRESNGDRDDRQAIQHQRPLQSSDETDERDDLSRSGHFEDGDRETDDAQRATMASDAYTMVNIVLQQHSTHGAVDQEFVNDVYRRVLQTAPYDAQGELDRREIEQTCLEEISSREDTWRKSMIFNSRQSQLARAASIAEGHSPTKKVQSSAPNKIEEESGRATAEDGLSPSLKFHRYKSSLHSLEDWNDASPSVSDWMQYAHGDSKRRTTQSAETTPVNQVPDEHGYVTIIDDNYSGSKAPPRSHSTLDADDDDLYSSSQPATATSSASATDLSQQVSRGSTLVDAPHVPKRITSLAPVDRPPSPRPAMATPSTLVPGKTSSEEIDSPEQRKLRKRRHIIKELVDTEFTYEKDLRVLCDIYKQTAPAALSDEDIKVLFGNIEQVQDFSQTFLSALKAAAKPTYHMDWPDRRSQKLSSESSSTRPNSSSSTLASTRTPDGDVPNAERDKDTQIGRAFDESLVAMERVYAEYIRNRQQANQRLVHVQKTTAAREWLKECRDNSSDVTNAWNLDALLVKPVQRVTKYPLLLKELVDATHEGHPDLPQLRKAFNDVTDINVRINEVKKQAELVDQVLNRKRKDSDVRVGLSKAFGRRAEKLKQHVGIAEMYEDPEYNDIKIQYDNNIVQLMVVGNDCNQYSRAVSKWVNRIVEIASAAEGWVDVGHSNHQEAESRLRQFAMVTRGISTIALPDHLEQLGNRVIDPMSQAAILMQKFKTDQKGLLQKRDKRLIDYAQAKNKKDRGERVDRKMAERMEQWEALNAEAKERMRKLVKATAKLVQACQGNLIQMQKQWLGMVKTKLSAAMGIPLDRLEIDDIRREWQMEFDFQEASALSLGICNGSLLAEAVNLVNFQTPSTTNLHEEGSPRPSSYMANHRRSGSTHSNGSQVHMHDGTQRTSSQYYHQGYDHQPERTYIYGSGLSSERERASTITTGTATRTTAMTNTAAVNRTSTDTTGYGAYSHRSSRDSHGAPQLNVDTPSPLIGSLQPESKPARPQSSSTYFSTSAETPSRGHHRSTSSSVFSSAMPMSDSPVTDRHPELPSREPDVLFTAASVYEFNIDRSRREAGFPYLTYVTGEIFDVIGERGELWLARNQDDPQKQIGWIWNKHFAKLAT